MVIGDRAADHIGLCISTQWSDHLYLLENIPTTCFINSQAERLLAEEMPWPVEG